MALVLLEEARQIQQGQMVATQIYRVQPQETLLVDAVLKAAKPTTLDTVLNMEEAAGLEATVLMGEAVLCSVLVAVEMVAQTEKQAVKAGHGEHTRQALEPMAVL